MGADPQKSHPWLRRFSPKAPPGKPRQLKLSVRNRLHKVEMRLQRLRLFEAEIFSGLDEIHAVAAFIREEIEQLDQLQLVVKIVLEPKNHAFKLAVTADYRVTRAESRVEFLFGQPPSLRKEISSDGGQVLKWQRRWNRAFVKNITPGQDLTANPGLTHTRDGVVAVRDD